MLGVANPHQLGKWKIDVFYSFFIYLVDIYWSNNYMNFNCDWTCAILYWKSNQADHAISISIRKNISMKTIGCILRMHVVEEKYNHNIFVSFKYEKQM